VRREGGGGGTFTIAVVEKKDSGNSERKPWRKSFCGWAKGEIWTRRGGRTASSKKERRKMKSGLGEEGEVFEGHG